MASFQCIPNKVVSYWSIATIALPHLFSTTAEFVFSSIFFFKWEVYVPELEDTSYTQYGTALVPSVQNFHLVSYNFCHFLIRWWFWNKALFWRFGLGDPFQRVASIYWRLLSMSCLEKIVGNFLAEFWFTLSALAVQQVFLFETLLRLVTFSLLFLLQVQISDFVV